MRQAKAGRCLHEAPAPAHSRRRCCQGSLCFSHRARVARMPTWLAPGVFAIPSLRQLPCSCWGICCKCGACYYAPYYQVTWHWKLPLHVLRGACKDAATASFLWRRRRGQCCAAVSVQLQR